MKRRKIYYVPGMISLIFLPILCVWYLEKNKNVERCFEIVYAQDYDKTSEDHRFDTSALSQPKYKRIYTEIYIGDNDKKNKTALLLLESKLNSIIKTKNKHLGLHITFADNAIYKSYIQSIDIIENCFKTNFAFHTYLPYKNDIWVMYLIDIEDVNFQKEHYYRCDKRTINSNDLNQRYKIFYIFLFIELLLLSIISIRYIIKNHINTNHKQK